MRLGKPPPLIERAYELAKSGSCTNVQHIRRQLSRDGYSASEIQAHLEGRTLRRELIQHCKDSARTVSLPGDLPT